MNEYPLLLGRNRRGYVKFHGNEHIALHARSGSGKTVSMSIPNCFAWPGSLIVLDVKGECYRATAGYRAEHLRQKVYRFDPTAEDGRTHRWNPFSVVNRLDPARRYDQISRLAFMLFPENLSPSAASGNAPFWEGAARQAFTSIALLFAESPGEDMTVSSILRALLRGDLRDWLSDKIADRRARGRPYSNTVIYGISDVLGANDDLMGSIRKAVTTKLQTFENPVVVAATATSDFDLRELRREPMTIYVTIAPGNIPRMRPILRMLFDQAVNLNTNVTPEQDKTLTTPVLVLLDEFARLDRIATLAEAAQFVRGYGIRLLYVIQNKAQMKALYGNNGAADIFDNLGAEIIFGTGDIDLAKEIENRVGDATVIFPTVNKPRFFSGVKWDKQAVSEHPHRRPVLYDHEIVQMPPDEQLILRAGMKPGRTGRIIWWKDRNFTRLVCSPPIVPELVIPSDMDDGSIALPASKRAKAVATAGAASRPPRSDDRETASAPVLALFPSRESASAPPDPEPPAAGPSGRTRRSRG